MNDPQRPTHARVRTARRRLTAGIAARHAAGAVTVAGFSAAALIVAVALWPDAPSLLRRPDAPLWIAAAAVTLAVTYVVARTFLDRPTPDAAAAEIDGRFGTGDRLASSLATGITDGPYHAALRDDADAAAKTIRVADRFTLTPDRRAGWPVAAMIAAGLAVLGADALRRSSTTDSDPVAQTDPQPEVRTVARQLKRTIKERREQAEAKGLKEAQELYQKMESRLDKIAKAGVDKKRAMIEINDLKKQLEERRDRLGSTEQMRKMMSRMKGISGPSEKIAKAMTRGEFNKAEKELRNLAAATRKGDLSREEQKKLAEQAQKMADQMKAAAEQHEKRKEELKRQIEQAKRDGRKGEAEQLQKQLDKAAQNDEAMKRAAEMAGEMQKAAGAMKSGDTEAAAEQLDKMADQMQQMQSEMDQMQELQEAMDSLQQGKQQMRCSNCGGNGCQACQNQGGSGKGEERRGMGEGNGEGDRPEEEDDTNTYKTQVRGEVKRGKSVIVGYADGPNRKGRTREAIAAAVESALQEESDPAENQRLPRAEREHTRQYFDALRGD